MCYPSGTSLKVPDSLHNVSTFGSRLIFKSILKLHLRVHGGIRGARGLKREYIELVNMSMEMGWGLTGEKVGSICF